MVRKLLCACALVIVSALLMSADLHRQTTADPISLYIKIKIGNETLSINLEAPGLVIDKYPDGNLKHLTIPFINRIWEVYFHPNHENQRKERVALVQRFRLIENRWLLDGMTQRFDGFDELLEMSEWEEGKQHGFSRRYNNLGQLLCEQEYEHGFPVNSWKQFYESGTLAEEIKFPPNRVAWEETHVPPVRSRVDNIYTMEYIHPIISQKVWYDQDGFKIREAEYELYQKGDDFMVRASGRAKSFDDDGNVVNMVDFSSPYGIGQIDRSYKSYAMRDDSSEIWFDGRLNKRTDWEHMSD